MFILGGGLYPRDFRAPGMDSEAVGSCLALSLD